MQAIASRADEATKESVESKVRTYKHRDSGVEVTGIQLNPGDMIQKGDVFDCPKTKRWTLSGSYAGKKVKETDLSVWIHPVSLEL